MLFKPFASRLLLALFTVISSNASASMLPSPIESATAVIKKEKVCAIYPHLKDSYWLSVNYGMVSEAEKQQVELKVLEAGGYPNATKQASQLVLCTQWGADAIILGTVSPDAYHDNLTDWVGSTPVFVTVNELTVNKIQQKILKGTVGVDWYQMGFQVGEYLAKSHPKGSGKTPIALLLGPQASGGTKPVALGFYDAIKTSDVEIAISYWADNDKELQRNLVQQVIEQPNIQYIVGSAVAIEAAISELRAAGKTNEIGLISSYLSHGIYRGLLRNKVLFAPTDKMVEQGRLSLKQAINYLRGQPYEKHSAPVIEPLTPATLKDQIIADSLSPSEFRPVFSVNP
ncbi:MULTISPECIES: TMAO reductase system periplasmic protein TorT [Vibrio]|jgi:periplasmic protein TorT|uniref:TMAO reductase system periplasmic protein TorT n=1 Tax=Vibrio kanaloae TaxID=170673 RepID=A0ABV4LFN2_9VIBR|nr:TMAO reductase system periplasmic protein TorT [Vibrio kanaloae]KAB0461994.1 TMAO reductase system periplasmic protein TorT [Vibrio kanaloae]NOJ01544.1 TMAO reductase system periplasmic protein TorT [Vibrio kanaloae]OEF15553.1 TMAO reductase system periplasmic protein TorT [Vibrio kanaloae 5S-149]QPK06450.1 TMAO reductase system periplasmic protein TorT [Vibrio kanaloae]